MKVLKMGTPEHDEVSRAYRNKLTSVSQNNIKSDLARRMRKALDSDKPLNMTLFRVQAQDLGYQGDVNALANEVSQQKFDEENKEE